MALLGTGAVAIWHDIAEEGREEFYAWHGREHMPERVAIPGFNRGRRYVALAARAEFFNLYEATDPAVLTGPDYLARLNHPTPWTVSTVRHFRNVARSVCRVLVSLGEGTGGLMATWRYAVATQASARHAEAVAALLGELIERPQVAAAHLLAADLAASSTETAERRARGGRNEVPPWILLVEGWGDVSPFDALCREITTGGGLEGTGVAGEAEYGLYRLQAVAA